MQSLHIFFTASGRSLVQGIATECGDSESDREVSKGDVMTQRRVKGPQEINKRRQKEDSYIFSRC